jgi:hypothetical protein
MNEAMKDKRAIPSALFVIPLGAWVALAPSLFGSDGAWEWNFNYFVLSVVPGAAAVLGGLSMLSGRRLPVSVGGLLALAGGLWLIAAPVTYPLWAGIGTGPSLGGSVWLSQWIVFFFGAGACIALVSSYALGFVAPLTFTDEAFEEPSRPSTLEPLGRQHARRHRPVRTAAQRARLHARR